MVRWKGGKGFSKSGSGGSRTFDFRSVERDFWEHNPSQNGHSEKEFMKILAKKRRLIDQINYSINKFTRTERVLKALVYPE
jgi:hypothetical protein